jgi:prepilin-type N-terminal cleavage/methylation domain-containing protein
VLARFNFDKVQLQRGFSLVELMAVVAIIGLLAAIAQPKLQVFVARARSAEAMKILNHVTTLQQSYYAENSKYASTAALGYTLTGSKFYKNYSITIKPEWNEQLYCTWIWSDVGKAPCPGMIYESWSQCSNGGAGTFARCANNSSSSRCFTNKVDVYRSEVGVDLPPLDQFYTVCK